MKQKFYDLIVVGGSTAGSYFARRMAQQGLKVLILEKDSREHTGCKFDIVHIPGGSVEQFGLPRPEEGVDAAFCFSETTAVSPTTRHSRTAPNSVVGLHLHPYVLRMNDWAMDAGAEMEYEACFRELLLDETGKVCGVSYTQNGQTFQVNANLVADCSGIPSVARRQLPEGCEVENFPILPESMYYVMLRYAVYQEPDAHRILSRNWRFYSVWEAPNGMENGAILGAAAKSSYDNTRQVFAVFDKTIPMKPYTVVRVEQGLTPYRRTPHSFVCDGFVAMGDAGCINRINGEGIVFAMVQADLAVETAAPVLKAGRRPTIDALWPINKRYNTLQGAAFAAQKALQLGKPDWNLEESEYIFLTDVFRSGEQLAAFETGLLPDSRQRQQAGNEAAEAGMLNPEKVRRQLLCCDNADQIFRHYLAYPETRQGFAAWCREADRLWSNCPGGGQPSRLGMDLGDGLSELEEERI